MAISAVVSSSLKYFPVVKDLIRAFQEDIFLDVFINVFQKFQKDFSRRFQEIPLNVSRGFVRTFPKPLFEHFQCLSFDISMDFR